MSHPAITKISADNSHFPLPHDGKHTISATHTASPLVTSINTALLLRLQDAQQCVLLLKEAAARAGLLSCSRHPYWSKACQRLGSALLGLNQHQQVCCKQKNCGASQKYRFGLLGAVSMSCNHISVWGRYQSASKVRR